MDIRFLMVMAGYFVGPAVLIIGLALVYWRRTRWIAASVLGVAIVAAALAAVTMDIEPYTWHAFLLAAFTVVSTGLGILVAAVWAVVAAIDGWEHRHAA
jgi:hypothetical protein